MKINYDKVADAIYFVIKKGKIARTLPVNECLNIDLDKNNETLGIELLNASSKQGLELQKYLKSGVPININSSTPVFA